MIPEWFRHAIAYEIYPQSFLDTNGDGIGDIPGIVQKLDYIRELGCDTLWINPCFDSPMQDAGYDVRDYYKVDKRYGTNEDLESLFAAAHEKGMHILLDFVPGHTSVEHEWFRKSQSHDHKEYSDFYIWTEAIFDKPKGYYWLSGTTERGANAMVNFFDFQPAINYGFAKITYPWQKLYTDPVCQDNLAAMMNVMRFWLDKGCDGFRVDMAGSLVKDDETGEATGSLWRRVQAMLSEEYPEAVLISEWSNPDKAISLAGFQGDFCLGFDGSHGDDLMRKGENSYFRKEAAGDFLPFIREYTGCYERTQKDGFICFVTGNHDKERASRYLTLEELKLAYAFLMTLPGVPFVYAGDEIGMRYLPLRTKEGGYFRTGSRTPMQWSREKNYGFSTAEKEDLYLPQDEGEDAPTILAQERDPDSLLCFLKHVLALRKQEDDSLRADAPFETIYIGERGYPYVYRRGNLILAMNPSAETKIAPVSVGDQLLLLGKAEAGEKTLVLGAQSFGVWRELPNNPNIDKLSGKLYN